MTFRRALALALLLGLGVVACGGSATVVIDTVDPDRFQQLIDEPGTVIIDIRTPEEFGAGRISGAINIDFYAADFADQLAELDRDTTYVVYCRSGNRSASAADTFRELAFTEVNELEGGILTWVQAGKPLVAG
jgi:phage shock protein E